MEAVSFRKLLSVPCTLYTLFSVYNSCPRLCEVWRPLVTCVTVALSCDTATFTVSTQLLCQTPMSSLSISCGSSRALVSTKNMTLWLTVVGTLLLRCPLLCRGCRIHLTVSSTDNRRLLFDEIRENSGSPRSPS